MDYECKKIWKAYIKRKVKKILTNKIDNKPLTKREVRLMFLAFERGWDYKELLSRLDKFGEKKNESIGII